MDRLPQQTYLNAANTPDCKFYLGGLIIPVVGQLPPPVTVAINTPLDWNDVIFKGRWEYSDSLIHPFHPAANVDEFLNKLKKVNYTKVDFQTTLLTFGFKQGKSNYWSFDLSERMYTHAAFPRDIFNLPILGNSVTREAEINGLHVNMSYYHQLSIGYKREISKYFNVGARVKFLMGVANVNMPQSNLSFKTEEGTNFITLSSNYKIQTNAPLDITVSETGFIDSIKVKSFDNKSNSELIKDYVLMTGNTGMALDFGFSKDWNSELTYFASVEDFGFIKWKENTNTITSESSEFTFEGAYLHYVNDTLRTDFPTVDSILNTLDFSVSQETYTTWLPMKIYAGVRYKLTSKLWLGGIVRMENLKYGMRSSYTGSLNVRPGKFSQFTLSYSLINNNFNNIGFGYGLVLGPAQWYLVTDNLAGLPLFPDNSRSASVRLGMNLVFGYKEKTAKRAIPLFNSNNSTNGRKLNKGKNIGTRAKQKKRGAMGNPKN